MAILSFRIFPQILVKKRVLLRVLGYFGPFLGHFWPIFELRPLFSSISVSPHLLHVYIYILKALSLSFNLSYNASMYHKNCGLNNFFTHLTGERNQDLRTCLISLLFRNLIEMVKQWYWIFDHFWCCVLRKKWYLTIFLCYKVRKQRCLTFDHFLVSRTPKTMYLSFDNFLVLRTPKARIFDIWRFFGVTDSESSDIWHLNFFGITDSENNDIFHSHIHQKAYLTNQFEKKCWGEAQQLD